MNRGRCGTLVLLHDALTEPCAQASCVSLSLCNKQLVVYLFTDHWTMWQLLVRRRALESAWWRSHVQRLHLFVACDMTDCGWNGCVTDNSLFSTFVGCEVAGSGCYEVLNSLLWIHPWTDVWLVLFFLEHGLDSVHLDRHVHTPTTRLHHHHFFRTFWHGNAGRPHDSCADTSSSAVPATAGDGRH